MAEHPRSAYRIGIGPPPGPRTGQLRAGHQRSPGHVRQHGFVTTQYAVVYVVAGSGHFVDGAGRRWPLGPGCLFQRRPDERHHVETVDYAAYFVAVPAACFELLRLTGLPTLASAVLEPGLDPQLVRRCETAIDHLREAAEDELAACLVELQGLIVDFHLRSHHRTRDPADHAFAQRACAALGEHCCDRLPLAAIARELGMGYPAFRKRFREQIGIAPGAYRIRRRMERAQALLADRDRPIEAIAARLGYADIFAFSAQFRRHVGRSPSRYRGEIG